MKRKIQTSCSLRDFPSWLDNELYAHLPRELGHIISSYHIPVLTSVEIKKTITMESRPNQIVSYKSHVYVFCDEICYVLDEYGHKIRQFKQSSEWGYDNRIYNDEIYSCYDEKVCVYDLNGIYKRDVLSLNAYSLHIMNDRIYVMLDDDSEDLLVYDLNGTVKCLLDPHVGRIFSMTVVPTTNSLVLETEYGVSIVSCDGKTPNDIQSEDIQIRPLYLSHYLFAIKSNEKLFIYDIYANKHLYIELGIKWNHYVNGEIWSMSYTGQDIHVYECLVK